MADVELRLIAQTDEYTSGIRQAQNANQSLYNKAVEGARREKRSIEEIRQEMGRLRTARNQSSDPKAQEVYNRKIREAGVHLKESQGNLKKYNEELKKGEQVTQKTTKTTGLLQSGMAKLMGAVGGVYGAYRGLISVLNSVDSTADRLRMTKAGLTATMNALAQSINQGDWSNLIENMKNAYTAASNYTEKIIELEHIERSYNLQAIKIEAEMAEQRNMMNERETKSVEERQQALKDYLRLNEELLNNEQEMAKTLIDAERDLIKEREASKEITAEQAELLIRYVSDYATLTKNELQNIRVLRGEEKALHDLRISQRDHLDSATNALTKADRIRFAEMYDNAGNEIKRFEQTIAAKKEGLTDLEKAYYDLDKEIDRLGSGERDRIAAALARQERAVVKEQTLKRVAIRFGEQLQREEEAKQKEADAKALANKEKFLAEIAKLEDSAEQQRIAGLEGIERIEAEKESQIKQLEAVEAQLLSLGELEAHHYAMLAQMRGVIYNNALAQEVEYWQNKEAIQDAKNEEERKKLEEEAKALQDLQHEVNIAELSLLNDNGAARLAYLIQQKQEEQAVLLAAEDETSQLKARLMGVELAELQTEWEEAVGITEEGIGLYVDALKTAYNEITNVLSAIFAEQVSHWQRERGLLDTRIAETQRALDQEIAINQQGYASNIALKKKELEELQAQRELALIEEEKALKKQQALDTISQVSNLITASAGIFNSLKALGPVGVGIAIATIATMFGAFAKVKIDAAKATKLAKGGSGSKTGMVTGATHSQGGEAFTDQIEVERGENWGVLAANKVPKYGKMFHQMVEAMNGDKFELSKYIPKPAGIVLNNNNNYTALENELKGLRRDIKNQSTVFSGNGYRIEKTGNKTRKIRTK